MNEALEPQVLDQEDQRVKELQALERELKEFSGGLPYDQARIIENTQDGFRQGVEGFYRAGLGLILIERHEDAQTSAQILEQFFPGISRRSAESYRQFARAASKLPNFKQFCLERGGYSKGLTMLQACTEAEIQEFEANGELRGFTREEIAQMSVRTMQKALLKAKEAQQRAVEKATGKLEEENTRLKGEVEAMQAAMAPAGLEEAKRIFKQAVKHMEEAGKYLRKVDIKLLAEDFTTRIQCLADMHYLRSMVDHLEATIFAIEEPQEPNPS
jgi:hypothetical protein